MAWGCVGCSGIVDGNGVVAWSCVGCSSIVDGNGVVVRGEGGVTDYYGAWCMVC